MSIKFYINGDRVLVTDEESDMPLLWFLREKLQLKGTKFGCGIGQCGACTVHHNGDALRSCTIPVSSLEGANITTIEGLAKNADELHPVQEAWVEHNVPQCGYCQPGQIMSAAAFLSKTKEVTDAEIEKNMTNICRCGTYTRIRKAVKTAATKLHGNHTQS